MKILQLCVFSNLWSKNHYVECIDLKNGKNVMDITKEHAAQFDLICAAPPCDQFTKANALRWENNPKEYLNIANKCLELCMIGKFWFIENPPGRIEKLIPKLKQYRTITWRDYTTNKEYVIYSNFIIMQTHTIRFRKEMIKRPKITRELWRPELIKDIEHSLQPP